MSDDFFRFPHTPHIEWLGKGEPRGDKLMLPHQVEEVLDAFLTVEEKVDGANVGFSLDATGKLRAQNRGAWTERDAGGQFKHLWSWAKRHEQNLEEALGQNLTLFGEWCYARHSLAYDALPEWFIGFDIYNRNEKRFYSVKKRNELMKSLGIEIIKPLATGCFSMADLKELLEKPSHYGSNQLEGIYLRQDSGLWLKQRAKLVRSDFTQTIDQHWSKKALIPNRAQLY